MSESFNPELAAEQEGNTSEILEYQKQQNSEKKESLATSIFKKLGIASAVFAGTVTSGEIVIDNALKVAYNNGHINTIEFVESEESLHGNLGKARDAGWSAAGGLLAGAYVYAKTERTEEDTDESSE